MKRFELAYPLFKKLWAERAVEFDDFVNKENELFDEYWNTINPEKIDSYVANPNIFFLAPELACVQITNKPQNNAGLLSEINSFKAVLYLPFRTNYFELLGDDLFSLRIDSVSSGPQAVLKFIALLVHELAPGKYVFVFLAQSGLRFTTYNSPTGKALARYLSEMLNKINSGSYSLGHVGFSKLKNKTTGHKTEVNKIIYVVPKKEKQNYRGPNNQKIDWSHKWEVRGHWRKTTTIGKDREGNYVINGFTWVKQHEKGKGELVKKTRIFFNKAEAVSNVRCS